MQKERNCERSENVKKEKGGKYKMRTLKSTKIGKEMKGTKPRKYW